MVGIFCFLLFFGVPVYLAYLCGYFFPFLIDLWIDLLYVLLQLFIYSNSRNMREVFSVLFYSIHLALRKDEEEKTICFLFFKYNPGASRRCPRCDHHHVRGGQCYPCLWHPRVLRRRVACHRAPRGCYRQRRCFYRTVDLQEVRGVSSLT